jgi:hypothetical protein
VFEILWTEGGDPAEIVASRGLRQVTDMGAIEAAVDAAVAANPDKAPRRRPSPRSPAGSWASDEGHRRQGEPAGGERVGAGQARHRVTESAMTSYDYKVTPAPKRMKRVKGVKTTAELFSLTLAEAINAAARDGWEYVRAESLPAVEEGGWFRRPVEVIETVLIFRRPREVLGPRLAAAKGDPAPAQGLGPVRIGAPDARSPSGLRRARAPERASPERAAPAALRREPRLGEPQEAATPLRSSAPPRPADQI